MFNYGQRLFLCRTKNYLKHKMARSLVNRIQHFYCQSIQHYSSLVDSIAFSPEKQISSNKIFDEEMQRQRELLGRIEKIEVSCKGLNDKQVTLIMNRGISTPYNCAQHLGEQFCQISPLALINGQNIWDMHRPLFDSCTLQLLTFSIEDPHIVNKAFWRSCSFMLGAALSTCLKDSAQLQLHSFPGPNVKSGSFVYDIVIKSTDWKPCKNELRALSAEMIRLSGRNLRFERLEVNQQLALDIFSASKYKSEQIPSIAQQNNGRVVLYRLGHHIDISCGPMIASTNFLGKCTVAAVHKLENEDNDSALYRVQGVALPTGFVLNHVAFGILEGRAQKLNPARLPNKPFEGAYMQMA